MEGFWDVCTAPSHSLTPMTSKSTWQSFFHMLKSKLSTVLKKTSSSSAGVKWKEIGSLPKGSKLRRNKAASWKSLSKVNLLLGTLTFHLRALVWTLAILFLIQLQENIPEKAADDGSRTHVGHPESTPGFCMANTLAVVCS